MIELIEEMKSKADEERELQRSSLDIKRQQLELEQRKLKPRRRGHALKWRRSRRGHVL